MAQEVRACQISVNDSVATALEEISIGDIVKVFNKNGDYLFSLIASSNIPIGHKIAVSDYDTGSIIFKYSQPIGEACQTILTGEHVHTHNLRGLRGRGDKE